MNAPVRTTTRPQDSAGERKACADSSLPVRPYDRTETLLPLGLPPVPHRKSSLVPNPPRLAHRSAARSVGRLAQGYGVSRLRKDALAGVVVGIVALPALDGARDRGRCPAAARPLHGHRRRRDRRADGRLEAPGDAVRRRRSSSSSRPIVSKYGLSGLLTAGLMAGVLLVAMGVMRLGRLIEFIPHPVTTGFTAGIASVIATLQMKDVLGLPIAKMPDGYLEKLAALVGGATGRLARRARGRGGDARPPARLAPRHQGAPGAARRHRLRRGRRHRRLARVAQLSRRHHRLALPHHVDGHDVAGIPQAPAAAGAPVGDAGLDARQASRALFRPRSPSPCSAPSSRCSRRSSPTR